MRKRINDAAAICATIVLLILVFTNIRIFSIANEFMEKHNASGYRETYLQPQLKSDGASVYLTSPITLRIIFLDEYGNKLSMDGETREEYYDFNKTIQNYIDNVTAFIAIYLGLTVSALVVSVKDRYNISGLILLLIVCLILISTDPILKFKLIPLGITAILGIYLTFKSRFVDYNQNRFFTFNKL